MSKQLEEERELHARVCVCVALVWHGVGLFLDELTTDLHNSVRRT